MKFIVTLPLASANALDKVIESNFTLTVALAPKPFPETVPVDPTLPVDCPVVMLAVTLMAAVAEPVPSLAVTVCVPPEMDGIVKDAFILPLLSAPNTDGVVVSRVPSMDSVTAALAMNPVPLTCIAAPDCPLFGVSVIAGIMVKVAVAALLLLSIALII